MSQEVWQTIPGFPRYEVSSQGRVRSNTTRGKGRILALSITGRGKPQAKVILYAEGGRTKHAYVRELVRDIFGLTIPAF